MTDQVIIELTPEQLETYAHVTQREYKPMALADEGIQPFVIAAFNSNVSQRGAYQFFLNLVQLEDPDDVASANDHKKVRKYVPIPISNPNTGYTVSEADKDKQLRQLRFLFSTLDLVTDPWPQYDKDSNSWSHEGAPISNEESLAIRNKINTKVLATAIKLYNDKASRDDFVNAFLWGKVEHKENTYKGKSEIQASVWQIYKTNPESVF